MIRGGLTFIIKRMVFRTIRNMMKYSNGVDHHPPQLVLEAVPLLWHVALQRLGLDGEVNTGFLEISEALYE